MHEIVEGRVAVWPQASRHHNFHVLRRPSPGYFVKQAVGTQEAATLAREAQVLARAAEDPGLVDLALCAPHFWAYDPAEQVLILEHLPAVEPLGVYQLRMGRFAPEAAALLGQVLAKLTGASRLLSSPLLSGLL